ncbi:uncharacterized protein LOC106014052 [Aplysia californica]|uniref:Uncharacterized protein LOC106014052 n=1 Tax=Aplysia californica TaxID=6500 RepID=A0ABM1AF85_APLCA|nr:uncharacterized protein LOC106014052 [Aplysia californica]
MAAPSTEMKALQVAVEHNATVLETILRTVQELHTESLKSNRRMSCLEMTVKSLVDRASPSPGSPTAAQTPGTSELSAKEEILTEILHTSHDLKSKLDKGFGDLLFQQRTHHRDVTASLQNTKALVTSQPGKTTHDVSAEIDNLSKKINQNSAKIQDFSSTIARLINITTFSNTKTKQELDRLCKSVNDTQARLKELRDTSRKQVDSLGSIRQDFDTKGRVLKLLRADSRWVIDQLIAEGQLIREVVLKKRHALKTYSCDFFITNFKTWVGMGQHLFSRLWYIDQAQTYVKGCVMFSDDKTMSVYLVHGRYPRTVGVAGRTGSDVRVSVAAVREIGTGDNWELGSGVMSTDETKIGTQNDGWISVSGCLVNKSLACDELFKRGFVTWDKVLLRYTITVQ